MKFTQLVSPALALWAYAATAQPVEDIGEACETDTGSTSTAAPVEVDVDVAIIGGGSGGIHAAIQLQAAGANVAVIEKENRIGGHCKTFYAPVDVPINTGVIIFENNTAVISYFEQLNVNLTFTNPVTDVPASTPAAQNFDFSLGIPIPAQSANDAQAQQAAIAAAVQSYTTNILAVYPWIDNGYLVPDPVPADLLLPFGELAKKFSFEPLLPIIAQFNWFIGDVATIPALYGIKCFGPGLVQSFFAKFIIPTSTDAEDLYRAAANMLGESIYYQSTIMEVKRTVEGASTNGTSVTVLINQPGQPAKLIRAKKLVVAIPPTMSNIGTYDLTSEETDIFSKFAGMGHWAGVVQVPGLANSVRNIGAMTPYNTPVIPGANGIELSASPGYFSTSVGFEDTNYTLADGENVVRSALATLETVGGVPAGSSAAATFPYSADHAPYNVRVSMDDISQGFYKKLLALQGQRNTYWTGAAFAAHNSGLIWKYNLETIVPGVIADLGL
ncbi:uncharacterized protein L3040_008946 [Drepanopeziza brunnea f. sp. 'multigermtubi']|uniref:uncharacterized protein n=1 Tax=Drepanopeziza brunnea f. sp. 'multigermtubi' TaxID=698441 RepID=UPI0023A149C2|nr:hypothetical protein L3040_008946 [Drepanopeziza brunnea f. sp. 'multigermtubi']